jgi:hypothetical protein
MEIYEQNCSKLEEDDITSQEIETKQTGMSVVTETSCTLIRQENTDVV